MESMTPGQQIKAICMIARLLSHDELDGEYVEVTDRWLEYVDWRRLSVQRLLRRAVSISP